VKRGIGTAGLVGWRRTERRNGLLAVLDLLDLLSDGGLDLVLLLLGGLLLLLLLLLLRKRRGVSSEKSRKREGVGKKTNLLFLLLSLLLLFLLGLALLLDVDELDVGVSAFSALFSLHFAQLDRVAVDGGGKRKLVTAEQASSQRERTPWG
jgi:hypothetical protein